MEKRKHPVVVVGCGASGIAALSKLSQAGIDVIGLEASDRIGGRINTVDFGKSVVDLGAAWCHGEINNLVYELASPHDLLGRPEKQSDIDADWFLLSNGTLIPTGNAQSLVDSICDALDLSPKTDKSISEYVRYGINYNWIQPRPAMIPFTEPFIEWYERDNHLGGQVDPATGKSVIGLSKHQVCPGEFWLNWKGKGYKTILDVMLKRNTSSPVKLNIQYHKRVVNINCNPPLEEEDPVPTLLVTCTDGTMIKASKVIVTVSLGVLKANYQTMFTPGLDADKISAINNLQFCILDKIYIEFEKPWWPKDLTNFRILWRPEDKQKFSTGETWITEIHGLRTVEHQPNVLLAWIYGLGAELMENVSHDKLMEGINKLLEMFSLNFNVTPVRRIKRSSWASDPLFRGSYSYRGVVTEKSPNASAEVLSQPVMHLGLPVICFAGEATSHKFHNAVHGAIDAGFREADRVINSNAG